MENTQMVRIINPKMKQRQDFPNIGLQGMVDLMDSFGFSVEIKLMPKATEGTVIKEGGAQ